MIQLVITDRARWIPFTWNPSWAHREPETEQVAAPWLPIPAQVQLQFKCLLRPWARTAACISAGRATAPSPALTIPRRLIQATMRIAPAFKFQSSPQMHDLAQVERLVIPLVWPGSDILCSVQITSARGSKTTLTSA